MPALCGTGGGKLIAVDGKSIRRFFEHGWDKSGVAHLVSAFVADNRMVFAQAKSDEAAAMLKLLALLDLEGATVTIDSMGCRREVARRIVQGGGDHVLALKGDQPALHRKFKATLDEAILLGFTAHRARTMMSCSLWITFSARGSGRSWKWRNSAAVAWPPMANLLALKPG